MPGSNKRLSFLVWIFLFSCGYNTKTDYVPAGIYQPQKIALKNVFTLQDFYKDDPILDSLTNDLFQQLTPKQRASQLIMDATSELPSAGLPFARAEKLTRDSTIGGLLFLKGSKRLFEKELKSLINEKPGLIFACDCEPSLFSMKLIGAERVKASRDLADSLEVAETAAKIAGIIKAMGIRINFAPVADIGLNKTVINNRSFGNKPADIILKSSAFISTTQQLQVAAAVKHFPGHGAIAGDTHKGQVFINGELSELSTFQTVIRDAAPIMVMVGHITVKNNPLYGTGGLPASVSGVIISQLLKTELGFKGIVVTDAMNMSALNNIKQADWKAILAGVDLVLMPRDARALNRKIVSGLQGGGELQGRLEASIKKMLRLKICLGG